MPRNIKPRNSPPFRLTHPPPPLEDAEHKLLANCLRRFLGPPGVVNSDGVLWFSIEHRNARTVTYTNKRGEQITYSPEGKRRELIGVVPGIPDICVRWSWRTFWVELKRERGGVLSDSQAHRHSELRLLGDTVLHAAGAKHALELLAEQGFSLRGRISA